MLATIGIILAFMIITPVILACSLHAMLRLSLNKKLNGMDCYVKKITR